MNYIKFLQIFWFTFTQKLEFKNILGQNFSQKFGAQKRSYQKARKHQCSQTFGALQQCVYIVYARYVVNAFRVLLLLLYYSRSINYPVEASQQSQPQLLSKIIFIKYTHTCASITSPPAGFFLHTFHILCIFNFPCKKQIYIARPTCHTRITPSV